MGDTVPLAEDTDMASGFLTATQGEDLTLSQRKHLKNEIKISFTHKFLVNLRMFVQSCCWYQQSVK